MRHDSARSRLILISTIIGIVAVAAVGLLTYIALNQANGDAANNQPSSQEITTTETDAEAEVPVIDSTSDLDEADATLDSTDIESSDDVDNLDSQSSDF